jgi:dihydroorotase-like cyclic amidohydrolase
VIRFAGVSMAEAFDMAAIRPRQLLGLPIHTIEEGQPADLVLFEWQEGEELRVVSVINK